MSLRPWLVYSLAALLVGARAFAQTTTDADLSADLKRRGDELLHASDFKAALVAYDEAYALDANPAILYNRSRALEGLGDWPAALGALERFDQEASPDLKARVPKLASLMSEQRAHVAMIAVTSPVTGASIAIRDKEIGTVPLKAPLRTNAGPATIEVRAAGYQTFRVTMDLPGNGSLTTIEAPLLRIGEKPPPPPVTQPAPKRSRVPSILLGSAAVAFGAAGAILLIVREGDASKLNKACPGGACPPEREKELTAVRDRALVEGPLAAGFFIGAGISLGLATILWPYGGSKKSDASARLVVVGDRVLVEGTF